MYVYSIYICCFFHVTTPENSWLEQKTSECPKRIRGFFCSFSFSVFVVFFLQKNLNSTLRLSSNASLKFNLFQDAAICWWENDSHVPCTPSQQHQSQPHLGARSLVSHPNKPTIGRSKNPLTLRTVLSSGGFDMFYVILCTVWRKRKKTWLFQRSLHSRGHHIVLVHIIVCMCIHHMYPENTDGQELRMPTSFHLSSNPWAVWFYRVLWLCSYT